MSVELLVDEGRYREALGRFNTQLDKLRGYKTELQRQIDRMQGATFSGTNVTSSINKAKDTQKAVDKAIVRAQKQRDAIEYVLNQSQQSASTLEKDMDNIEIPNLFK